MRRLALTCLLACAALSAHAQSRGVYTWKDARGVTHYADTPPASGRYASVRADAAARVAPLPGPDPRCSTARSNIERLRGGRADIGLDADGDGRPDAPLTEAQRGEQLRLAQAAERAFCTAAGT